MSYLSGIYSESWFSWLREGVQKILRKRKIQAEENIDTSSKEKQRIQGKSNNNNEHLRCYFLYKELYFSQEHSLKRTSLYHQI